MNLIKFFKNLFISSETIKINFFILISTVKQDYKSILLNSGFNYLGLVEKDADELLFSAIVQNNIGYLIFDIKDHIDLYKFISEHFSFEYKKEYSKLLFSFIEFKKGDTIYLLKGGNKYEFELYRKY